MRKKFYDVNYTLDDDWWYKGRRDLLKKLLKSFNVKFKNSLDLGCGVGVNLGVLQEFSEKTTGVDYSKVAISYCKKRYKNVMLMDATRLKFKDNSFDLVICMDILEHIKRDDRAIAEACRVLNKGGYFIFSVPAHKYLWTMHDNFNDHFRRYEKDELVEKLDPYFEIKKLSYWNSFSYIPLLFFSFINRNKTMNNERNNNLTLIPRFLKDVLYHLICIENSIFLRVNIPQGVSIIGICQKN